MSLGKYGRKGYPNMILVNGKYGLIRMLNCAWNVLFILCTISLDASSVKKSWIKMFMEYILGNT